MVQDDAFGAWARDLEARGFAGAKSGGICRAGNARQRKTSEDSASRRRAAGGRPVPLYGRMGDQDRGQYDSDFREVSGLHLAPAGRSGRSDHPVEFSVADGGLETGPGIGDGMHRGDQTGGENAADLPAPGRTSTGSRT